MTKSNNEQAQGAELDNVELDAVQGGVGGVTIRIPPMPKPPGQKPKLPILQPQDPPILWEPKGEPKLSDYEPDWRWFFRKQ